jgi:hypothetical protein
MAKLVTLVRAVPGLAPEAFAARWRDEVLPAIVKWPGVRERLVRATHHHAIPSGIRAEEGIAADAWSGVGTYDFEDGAFVEALAVDANFLALHGADAFAEVAALPVDGIWVYNQDPSPLPLKMFAFFKRKAEIGRAEAQHYYRTTHAEIGESINRQRTVRYIQNHVRPAFRASDPRFDFDAGPEIWFKSMEIALDLFNDAEAMRILSEDEERFVLRGELMNLLTDEQVVWQR